MMYLCCGDGRIGLGATPLKICLTTSLSEQTVNETHSRNTPENWQNIHS